MIRNKIVYIGILLVLSLTIMAFAYQRNSSASFADAFSLAAREGLSQSEAKYELFVSDANNFEKGPWKILRYDGNGRNGRVFTKEQLGWPQDIVILEEEEIVLVSNLTTGKITRYSLSDGSYLGDFATVAGGPTRMKFGPDGFLYVLQWKGNGKVIRFTRNGSLVDEFTSAGVNQSIGLDWDEDGNLYVSSFGNSHVRRFDDKGRDLGLFIDSELVGPTDISFVEGGALLVNDWKAGLVMRFSAEGRLIEEFTSGVSQAEGLSSLPNGNVLVGHGSGACVKEYDRTGRFVRDVVAPKAGGLQQPNAVTVRVVE